MDRNKTIKTYQQAIDEIKKEIQAENKEKFKTLIGKCFDLASNTSYVKLTDILDVAPDHIEFECIGVDFSKEILKINYDDDFRIRVEEIDYWLRRAVSEEEFEKFMIDSLNYHLNKIKET